MCKGEGKFGVRQEWTTWDLIKPFHPPSPAGLELCNVTEDRTGNPDVWRRKLMENLPENDRSLLSWGTPGSVAAEARSEAVGCGLPTPAWGGRAGATAIWRGRWVLFCLMSEEWGALLCLVTLCKPALCLPSCFYLACGTWRLKLSINLQWAPGKTWV